MRYFKDDGRQYIDPAQPQEVGLDTALADVAAFPDTDESNFIGFVNDVEETVQLQRTAKEMWLVDVPVRIGGKYRYSLQGAANTEQVKELVRRFSQGADWRSVVRLAQAH